jgi:tetratricopeptide (TPR) repeat protein
VTKKRDAALERVEAAAARGPRPARAALNAARAAFPKDAEFLELEARLLAGEGRLAAALSTLDRAASLPGAPHTVFVARSGARLLSGDARGGWEDLLRAFELSPTLACSYGDARTGSIPKGASVLFSEDAFETRDLLEALSRAKGPFVRTWRGILERRLGDYAGAAADLGEASAMALTYRGEARLQLGDAGGFDDLARAARAEDKQAWNLAWLGRCLIGFGRKPEALAWLDRAVALSPEDGWLLAWRAEAKRQLGVKTGLVADLDRALSRGLRSRSHRAWVRAWRGLALLDDGKPALALKDFDAALELKPRYPAALSGRARANRALGRLDAWIRDLELCAEADERQVQAWQGRPAEDLAAAAGSLAKAGSAEALAWRGYFLCLHFLCLLGDFDAAQAALTASARRAPKRAWTQAWLGLLAERRGNPRDAVAPYTKALSAENGSPLISAWRARAHLALGDARKALRDLEAAASGERRFSWILADLGRVRLMVGRAKGAAEALRAALVMDGNDASVWADLAAACAKAGDREGRLAAEKRARELDPEILARRAAVWGS